MSSSNGVVKIANRGLVKFQFGEDEAVVLDVIEVYDSWHEVNMALRVHEGTQWRLPNDKVNEHAVNRLNLVQGFVAQAYTKAGKTAPTLSRFEAEAVIATVEEEAMELRNFIYKRTDETSSTPESTEAPTFAQ